MTDAPLPQDEDQRVCRLHELELLDTASEPEFDAFTRTASAVSGMPIAVVSLVDSDRQWFKSAVGLPQGSQTGRQESFCGHAIAQRSEIFEIEDATHHPDFFDNPLVTGAPYVVHYAGATLVLPTGERIGTLCLIDQKPGRLQAHERELLKGLAEAVVSTILLRERELQLQRTLTDRNMQLASALDQAQDANRAKSDFLATMSHELRTPLNAILGFAHALELGLQDPEQQRQARHVRETGETLTAILNDILDLAKIEAGRFDLDPQPFELTQVFESCANVFQVSCVAKGVAFEMSAPEVVPPLVGDAVRLRQILQNLLSNSVKFTAAGTVSLSLALEPLAPSESGTGRCMVTMRVRDTGLGMDQQQLGRLFQRYEQGSRSTAGVYGGTGLGLSIVKALVERMKGTINVRSTPGHGSEFTISIPFDVARFPLQVGEQAEGPAATELAMRVLVVDDLKVNRHVLRALLQRRGHTVVEAEDGVQAIEAVMAHQPDVVLMDVDMPIMDGLEACRRLRDSEQRNGSGRLPVFALTGKAFPEDIARCEAAGMDGHLAKPVNLSDLVGVLRSVRPG